MRWPHCRRRFIILMLLGVIFVSWLTWEVWPRPITVGRSTTYLTGPLRPDGKVDYIAALDAEYRAGVTLENNAVVVLATACGPTLFGWLSQDEGFQQVGIPVPAESGRYLQPLENFAESEPEDSDRIYVRAEAARNSVWKSDKFPEIAAWIAANNVPLQLCREASLRSRLYCPVTGGEWYGFGFMNHVSSKLREFTRLLRARAMLRLGTGDTAGAFDDLDTIYRLSWLSGQFPVVMQRLQARSLELEAIRTEAAIALSGVLSREQLAARVQATNQGERFPSLSRSIDHIDRCTQLEMLQSAIDGEHSPRSVQHAPAPLLIQLNRTLDACVLAASKETYLDQVRALKKLESRLKLRTPYFKLPEQIPVPSVSLATLAGDVDSLQAVQLCMVYVEFDSNVIATRSLLQLILASADHKALAGRFPDTLEQLQQHFGTNLPTDPFSECAFHYVVRNDEQKLQIYSVGPNGRDDRGRWAGQADDIALGNLPTE